MYPPAAHAAIHSAIVVIRIAVDLPLQLSTGIILLETSSISVEAEAICSKRSSLFRNSCTVKLNVLLPEVRIIDVHCPLSIPGVGIVVPLLFRN
jgi:hypothetical protein